MEQPQVANIHALALQDPSRGLKRYHDQGGLRVIMQGGLGWLVGAGGFKAAIMEDRCRAHRGEGARA